MEMYNYLKERGHLGTASYYKGNVVELSPSEIFYWNRSNIMSVRLDNMVDIYGPENICYEVYYMGQYFYDFTMMCHWYDGIFSSLDPGIEGFPGGEGGSNEGNGNEVFSNLEKAMGKWNGSSHKFILLQAIQSLDLPQDLMIVLEDASKWCDNLLVGNQSSNKAVFHAMRTSNDQSPEKAQENFEIHLKKYLERSIERDDYWDMGIALHGITDSFCPAHQGFQYFDWGDVSAMVEHSKWDNWVNSPERTIETIEVVKNILEIAYGNDEYIEQGGRAEVILRYWKQEYGKL